MSFWEAVTDWVDDMTSPEEGTITPAPSSDGPYDISDILSRSEIMAFVDEFEPAVHHAMLREAAKEIYPDYADFIDMSQDEWERAKDATGEYRQLPNGSGGMDAVLIARWNDELEFVLPTNEGMDYFEFYSQKRRGPDPASAVDGILSDGGQRSETLMGELRTACSDALGEERLESMRDTAKQHAKLYDTLDAAVDELAETIGKLKALAEDWEGNDASLFEEQYANSAGPALSRHTAMALNLRQAADTDLGIQAALHAGISVSLKKGESRVKELSTKSVFEGEGINVVTASTYAIGGVSLVYGGAGIALTGLLLTGASSTDLGEWNINPQYDTLPTSEDVRELVTKMNEGFENAAEDAARARENCKGELTNRSDADRGLIGDPTLVPGSGYYG